MIKRIAVIGAGRMGGGIARSLAHDRSFSVSVFDLDQGAVRRCVDAGAAASPSVAAAVADAELVITSLPTPEVVLSIYRDSAAASLERAIWMDVSTVDASTARQLEDLLASSDRRFVACALGKGPAEADAGTLPLFVGCAQGLLEELDPVFTCIGAAVHYLGTVEAAAAFKVISNMVGMTNLAVLAEGYELCHAYGVVDDAFMAALKDTGAWSYQAELRLPWMVGDDFTNRFGVDLALKDVRLAVDSAARCGVPAPVGAAGLMQLASAHASGLGDEDVDALLKVVRHSG